MLNVGMSEIFLFAIIALIVLGPEKLPTAVRTVMKWYRHIKLMISNVQRDIERELEITEIREQMTKELERIKAIEEQMQTQLNQIQKEMDQIEKVEDKQNKSHVETQTPDIEQLEAKTNPKETQAIETIKPETVTTKKTHLDENRAIA